ncbi:MAG: hypothetical protein JRN20_05065 [Nitrososphaerota archaeon]|nr:hypothetical protein [Nitrososphaerota archaeon]
MRTSVGVRIPARFVRAFKKARSASEWYRNKIALEDIKQNAIINAKLLESLPIVSRNELSGVKSTVHSEKYIDIQDEASLDDAGRITRLFESDYAELVNVYQKLFKTVGVKKRDIVLISDYGSSPISYLASNLFCTFQTKGLAERLGFVALCTDGMPEFVQRTIHVIESTKPKIVVIRHDLIPPLVAALRSREVSLKDLGVATTVVTANCDTAGEEAALASKLGTKVRRFLRDDLAFFVMIECKEHNGFHIGEDSYLAEIVDYGNKSPITFGETGRLVVSALFPTSIPIMRFETSYEGYLKRSKCSCTPGKKASRVLFFPT